MIAVDGWSGGRRRAYLAEKRVIAEAIRHVAFLRRNHIGLGVERTERDLMCAVDALLKARPGRKPGMTR